MTTDNALDLTPDELAEKIRIPVGTLKRWRLRKQGPPWVRWGKHVRYPVAGVESWMAESSAA